MPYAARRTFLRALAAGGGLLWLGGCGYYAPGRGAAYAPWSFPSAGAAPPVALIHAALLAASPHNTQPWLFRFQDARIDVHADDTRLLGAMDPMGREQRVGLGCAIENMLVASRQLGCPAAVAWLPDATDPSLVARLSLGRAAPVAEPLYPFIALRHTNRGPYADGDLPAPVLSAFAAQVADLSGVELHLLTGAAARSSFAEGTVAATERIIADVEMLSSSHAWLRSTFDDIQRHRDGLTIDAQGYDALTTALGKMLGAPSLQTDADYWLASTRDVHVAHASAFAVLSTADLRDALGRLQAGRAYQRLHLYATSAGLAMQPLNQMLERRDREIELGLPAELGDRLAALLPPGRAAQMAFRIGVPWDDARPSPRRPVEWVAEAIA
jgi:hypothetical protein